MISNRIKHHRVNAVAMLIHALSSSMPLPPAPDLWLNSATSGGYPVDTGGRSGVRAAQREAVRRRNRRRHNRRAKLRRSVKNPIS